MNTLPYITTIDNAANDSVARTPMQNVLAPYGGEIIAVWWVLFGCTCAALSCVLVRAYRKQHHI